MGRDSKKPQSSYYSDPHLRTVNFREHPELYRIGRGEQGVLLVEPYKSELLPHWGFRTPDLARSSARKLYSMFLGYLRADDFPGADMARKFLQMGWTRSRRYANRKSGRKYNPATGALLPRDPDPVKAESAAIFYRYYVRARSHPQYVRLKERHHRMFEGQ